MNKSVENLLISSHEVISSINSTGLGNQGVTTNLGSTATTEKAQETSASGVDRNSPVSSPNLSPRPSPRAHSRREYSKNPDSAVKESLRANKSDDQLSSGHQDVIGRSSDSADLNKSSTHENKKEARSSERSKKKSSWYNVLYPTYKSRSEDFKRIFKDVPDDERLVVDYSCALQREILVHGRLYVSQNYVCFYANIFMWETLVSLRWKDVTSITKEKTALVIPNAILICTITDKFFLTSFGARDKTYVMLFRVWQNALIGEPMSMAEMWQLVHTCYGDELGLTSDDEDYVPPLPAADDEKLSTRLSVESFSETEAVTENSVSPATDPVPGLEPAELQVQPPAPSTLKPEPVLDPTDLSDTTESEAEKHGLKMNIRSTMVCTSLHEGRQINKATLPIYIDQLFTLLFTNSKFFLDFHTSRKTTDLIQSAWTQNNQTGQKMRTLSYTMSLTQNIGPRTSQITETQVMLPCSRPGHLYCIDVESVNAGIPYADSFSVLTHYCMNNISENETSLIIYSQIKYKKSVWGFVKSVLEKNCWAGLEEYFNSLIKALTVECEEGNGSGGLKRKTRKRRRATGVGAALQTHTSEHISVNHQISPSNLSHNHAANTRSDTNIILSSMLLVAVLCLMVINGLLYYKLWGLEEAAAYTIMDLHVLKYILSISFINTPKTEEDWINLLQQQESLHNVEMRKWQRVLHTAAQLLRQTEESLTELQMSIHPTATEKMFSVLKPHLKSLNAHTERRGKSEM
ncbi:GRAM domain-containing protein 1B isoform X1 [Mycetomoellerius zeteki]|uniref:GRAM domain-containing protein 1B isoform X1 n=1 Tax=Mycetomoellerius zeteki TaxID=64791 RepID=UPI00084ED082|nr:PREDICTED: GRAM domain-containing protein 1B-like isoform X1 [Trachymyrmex zeteki]XP_018305386.1 PREDICTED: GRAM domain-containing protein 1B-like isoform X1 [Trachymyrmex zeteki]XP_018305387.1 PREDICTED: GRAM domain-containing protein 1B-like isoform X1 [Trachymyrmex zeteki]XP_018305388.1 PREDICTED: GRAM domain-containing protein 1B-like isoform X1 [Trachymyrmex zeteki]